MLAETGTDITSMFLQSSREALLQVPERRDGVLEKLCSWAAASCLGHLEGQLRGRVLYAIVPAGPARVLRRPLSAVEHFLPRVDDRLRIPARFAVDPLATGGYYNVFLEEELAPAGPLSCSATDGSALATPRERQPKKKVSPGPPPQDLARQIFHKGFFFGALLEEVWKWLQTRRPYVVRYGRFRKEVITRPKENFALQRADGAFPSYQWGQVKADYTLIEVTPEPVLKCARMLETHFGHPEGYLNSQLATYYVHGEDQYLVIHQDKAVDHRSTGDVEDSTPIYNASFGAMRHFVLTDLASLGEHERGKMLIYEDFAMHSGDLVVIPPKTNRDYGHGVYKDPSADRLRVSIVFRHVDKHWVRKLEDGTWEHCSRDSHGDDGPWAPLPLGDEPATPAGRLDARRELCEEKLREKQERREQRGGKRARKQQPGAPGDLEPLSAHLGAGDTAV